RSRRGVEQFGSSPGSEPGVLRFNSSPRHHYPARFQRKVGIVPDLFCALIPDSRRLLLVVPLALSSRRPGRRAVGVSLCTDARWLMTGVCSPQLHGGVTAPWRPSLPVGGQGAGIGG